jgi:transposase
MSEQEMLVLSTRDRDRLKVLHEVKQGHLTQRAAAEQLQVSDRWVRQLLGRMRREGDRGVVHRLRGRVSPRRLGERRRNQILKLVKAKYRDFGPTLAAEYLGEEDGIAISKETLRQLLTAAGLWRAKRRRAEEVHVWRPRRSCRGELVQWDTSEHQWLEGRGPRLQLVAMIDDASSIAYGRFVGRDTMAENLRVLWGYLECWGRPVEFYTDKDSLFTVNRPAPLAADEAVAEELTQIGRALRELGIGWIAAHSPQAKGRIERFFGTAQDRLVKGMRRANICSLEQANTYLEGTYLPLWNRRFTVAAANPTDAHRRLLPEHHLAAILSQVEERVVTNDYAIRYQGKIYQIGRKEIRAGMRGGRVRVKNRLDGSLAVRFRDRYLGVQECKPQPKPALGPKVRTEVHKRKGIARSGWMDNFNLRKSSPVWAIVKAEGTTPATEAAPFFRG